MQLTSLLSTCVLRRLTTGKFARFIACAALLNVLPAHAQTSLHPQNQTHVSAALTNTPCIDDSNAVDVFGAQCYSLTVAENPQAPNGRNLDLHITRLPALQETQKPPLFFIAGGPGQASSDLLAVFRHEFSGLLVDHDFVFVDQRGTGHSAPLNCDTDLLPLAALSPDALEAKAIENLKACITETTATTKADFRYYTTPYAVADLHQVRQALGYDSIFLWGGSYGTRVVLDYLRRHGDTVAGAILDGIAPIAIQLPTFAERDGSRALAAVFQRCESAPQCRAAFPDLSARWQQHLQKLSDAPTAVELKHARTQEAHTVYVNEQVVSAWVRLIMYSRNIVPILPLALDRATQGDYSLLFSVYSVGLDSMAEGISELMQTAVLCAEDARYSQLYPTQVDDAGHLLRLPTRNGFDKSCALFPASTLTTEYFAPVKSDVPSLLLSGQLDPVTPPSWGDEAGQTLSRSQHVIVNNGHHIVSRLGCVPAIIERFVAAPNAVEKLDTGCVENIAPPHFFIDAAGPTMQKTLDAAGAAHD